MEPQKNAVLDDPWSSPDLTLAAGARRPAPKFPLERVLSLQWQKTLLKRAAGAGAPIDYVVGPLFSAAAAIIGNARRVSPWPSWSEPAVIWTMIVGLSGDGKSPASDVVFDPLRQFEMELAQDFPDRLREYKTVKAEAEARREQWKRSVATAIKNGQPVETMPANAVEPERPERTRFSWVM